MQSFQVKDSDKWLLLGCFNTTLLIAENNLYNLQHKKEPLLKHEQEASSRLQYEINSVQLLKSKLLETMPSLGIKEEILTS